MTTFHEGQEVEVDIAPRDAPTPKWRKAKIVNSIWHVKEKEFRYRVQFPDGSRAVFNEAHIRAVEPAEEYPGLAEPDDDTSEPMGSGVSP